MVDAHAHLEDPRLTDDLDAVIARAHAAGVIAIVTAGGDLESSARAVRLAETYPAVYAAVGYHPHEASRFQPGGLDQLRAWCAHPKVVAVGEIGLDFYYDRSPREVQRRVLEAHLGLASEVGLPVVVHCREAGAALLEVLRAWSAPTPFPGPSPEQGGEAAALPSGAGPARRGMIHCFSGDADLACRFLAVGMDISLAGPVTFTNARELQEVARAVPLDALLVETDSPYLAPHPHRGQRNEPALVAVTARRVAELRGMDFPALAQATSANAARLFGLPLPVP